MNLLVLYTELAQYLVDCLHQLRQMEPGIRISIVAYPINEEAPFQFDRLTDIEIISRNRLESEGIAELKNRNWDLVLCSGWGDSKYLSLVKYFKHRAQTCILFDNPWEASLRQLAGSLWFKLRLKRFFHFAFVPGEPQTRFARKLGFSSNYIFKGFYSCEPENFSNVHQQMKERKSIQKRFIFLGRYVAWKGIFELWEAFESFHRSNPDWELLCCGTGEEYSNRVQSPGIEHLGFIQPSSLPEIMEQGDVYILPSHKEPWGVSVHEFAAAGFPLLISDKVGSAEAFARHGRNAYIFHSGDVVDLQRGMNYFASMPMNALRQMGIESRRLAEKITPRNWARQVYKMLYSTHTV